MSLDASNIDVKGIIMDNAEYKEKKIEKIMSNAVKRIFTIPSFGFGENIDNLAKMAITNYILSLVYISEIREDNIDVIAESIIDELGTISCQTVSDLLELSRVK